MFLVHIAAFLVFILAIAWRFKIRFVESIPVGSSLLVLGLYALSFFGRLTLSDAVALIWLAGAAVYVLLMPREKRQGLAGFCTGELSDGGTITALAMTVIVTICVSDKAVSWWDDYNFWATDVKSLFYLDGFAGKYANVAAEFGDYPPGTQMMKWWFLHFSPKEFKEGLMFAGYYFFNLSFLFPLLKVIRKRNVFAMALGGALLWLFPAVAEAFWMDGCCADLTMALCYGAFLTSVADERKDRLLYYGRQALFLSVLVLCKNTGFLWAAFGLLFDYGYHLLMHKKRAVCRGGAARDDLRARRADRRGLFLATLFPVLVEMSWLLFCLFNRRVAKLTGTAIQMATGGMNLPAWQEEMVKAFVEAFVKWPLHRGKTIAIDLTPLSLYLLLILAVFILWRFHVLEGKRAAYTGGFLAVSGAVFYTINLVSHLTIFAVETQYLEPFGMVSSIERYGAPFAIGGMYFLAFYVIRAGTWKGIAACAVFVLLTTDYGGAFRALYGYRADTAGILAERESIVDEAAERFLDKAAEAFCGKTAETMGHFLETAEQFSEATGTGGRKSAGRVLYLRDISDVSWVRNTYIGFEASPVSVIYGNVDAGAMGSEDIVRAIEDAHAGFLYVDELAGDGEKLFQPLILSGDDKFEYGCLYQVAEEYDGIGLVKFYGAK